jgi:hypothetical protein
MDLSGNSSRKNLKREAIREFAAQHPGAMVKDVADYFGMSPGTAGKYLAEIRAEWRRELRSKSSLKSRKVRHQGRRVYDL